MLLYLAAAILFVPVLTGVLALLENHRAGDLARQRERCGCLLPLALARAFCNSVWSLWLTVLILPLGRLPARLWVKTAPATPYGDHVPVLLVHGLYHNPGAWLVFRRRLAAAGFADVRTYGYASFGQEFADIVDGLALAMLEAAEHSPGRRVLLVGHSLGGLVIRAACADKRISVGAGCRVSGVATLGSPHCGSTLAGILGLGKLARGLTPGGEIIRLMRSLPVHPERAMSLYTPTDGMVLPLSGALVEARERAAGWQEVCLRPMSHVGLLYDQEAAAKAVLFLRDCCREVPGASCPEVR